mmetsp:Transcript_28922/g.33018  ORF Transcript_28922/g.33018 Transcript_28922/m.33018 type:complete len:96 (+) Transcript_28922:254-541(+)
MPLIGGFLVDRIGIYITILLFTSFLMIGQSVFMIGGFLGTDNENDDLPFILAIVGRSIYGLGGEILTVCQSTIVSKWFVENELSFSLGIVLSLSW